MNKMKAFVVAVLVCTMFSSCGEKDTESESTASESVVSTETDTVEAEESVPETTEQITEATTEQSDIKLHNFGVETYIPSDFEEQFTRDGYLFKSHLDNGDDVYFVYHGYTLYTDDNPDDFTLLDVVDIQRRYLFHNIDLNFPTFEEDMIVTIESETEENIMNCPFLYHTGMIHTECYEESADLSFAAYYGIVSYKPWGIEKAPIMWVAYSDTENEETISYMQEVVKFAAENAKLQED